MIKLLICFYVIITFIINAKSKLIESHMKSLVILDIIIIGIF